MTTGDEHYRHAEAHLEAALGARRDDGVEAMHLGLAQAHATLAVAAATIDAAVIAAGHFEVVHSRDGGSTARLAPHSREGLGYGR